MRLGNVVADLLKKLCWPGIQDAARKRRKPSKCPGAWAGATVESDGPVVTKGVTQERWDKVRLWIQWLARHVGLKVDVPDSELDKIVQFKSDPPKGHMHFKTAESIVGFLVMLP